MGQDIKNITISLKRLLITIGRPLYFILLFCFITVSVFFIILEKWLVVIRKSFRLLSFPSTKPLTLKIKLPSLRFHNNIFLYYIIVLIPLAASFAVYAVIMKDLPHPQQLTNRHQPQTSQIFDRNNHLLYQMYQDQNRTLVRLEDIPQHVIAATLAIEDSDFYQHPGFSLRGISRALKLNLLENQKQGGSTITQQLVKNVLLTPEKTITRKFKELLLSIAVESYYTKDEILNMYFNEVSYGGTAYGIEAASQQYFGKSVDKLNLKEAALLAGLPAAPTTYSPFGAHPEKALARSHQVLSRMQQLGMISLDQYQNTVNSKLTYTNPNTSIKAPHFVMYSRDLLVNQYSETEITQGGLEIVTTLDLELQEWLQQILKDQQPSLSKLNISNAAVLITNPKNGDILAMVGSLDYWDTKNDGQVNVTNRLRQPGSSIKPITYALALESGFTPATIIQDSPVTYIIPGSPSYTPRNYDGRFHGLVTLRQALANSYNIPAVKVLNHLGVSKLINKGRDMGITTWEDTSRFGLSLTLGGGDIKMIDMATAFGVFANNGLRVDLNPILSIIDTSHKQIYQKSTPINHKTIISPHVAYQINHILSDNKARSQAFGPNSLLSIPGHQVAVKTGTSNNLRDNWAIGYTTNYVVAVWVGNNDNSPMSRVASGISGASEIWNLVMTNLLKEKPEHAFIAPPDIVTAVICVPTGTLNCQDCPYSVTEYFAPNTEPVNHCSPEQISALIEPEDHTP